MTHPAIALITEIYAAFGQADVPAILARLTDDCELAFEGASPAVPWHGPWRGPDGTRRFFAVLAEEVAFEVFAPLAFAVADDAVAVRVHLRYRVRRTDAVVDQVQVHWWGLRDGKSTGLRHFEDTAQVVAACRR